ncbi:MAG: hypothetical protein WC376_05520 [Candidatus Nanoarchaeia archaeon]
MMNTTNPTVNTEAKNSEMLIKGIYMLDSMESEEKGKFCKDLVSSYSDLNLSTAQKYVIWDNVGSNEYLLKDCIGLECIVSSLGKELDIETKGLKNKIKFVKESKMFNKDKGNYFDSINQGYEKTNFHILDTVIANTSIAAASTLLAVTCFLGIAPYFHA